MHCANLSTLASTSNRFAAGSPFPTSGWHVFCAARYCEEFECMPAVALKPPSAFGSGKSVMPWDRMHRAKASWFEVDVPELPELAAGNELAGAVLVVDLTLATVGLAEPVPQAASRIDMPNAARSGMTLAATTPRPCRRDADSFVTKATIALSAL